MSSPLLTVLKWLDATDLDKEPQVLKHAKWLVLDTLGCVMAGLKAEPGPEAEALAALEEAPIDGSPLVIPQLNPAGAAGDDQQLLGASAAAAASCSPVAPRPRA